MSSWTGLICVMLSLAAALVGMVVVAMARMLLRPPRMTDGKAAYVLRRLSPGDLGLPFETVTFPVRDRRDGRVLNLAGWWMPAGRRASDRCAVIIHGYADAKVGGIAWAPLFHGLGFNVLAIDLRGHGESDGLHCTGGDLERHDLDQVLDQLRSARPEETRQLVLFGVSLGAAVAVGAAALRDDVAAVILESPFASFPSAAQRHAQLLGLPRLFVQRAAIRLAQWLADADFDSARPVDLIPQVGAPLMLIQSAIDPFVSEPDKDALEQSARSRDPAYGPTVTWRVDGAEHVLGLAVEPEEYRRKIEGFLQEALARTCAAR